MLPLKTKPNYDYLIVGAGPFGSVFAHEMTKRGKKCLVVDKRDHAGGNLYCKEVEGIQVHQYGPHVFHTNDLRIWEYVNSFVEFNEFVLKPMANYEGKHYNFPINMNTFRQLWGVASPEEARKKIAEQIGSVKIDNPQNLEEYALKLVGPELYNMFIKGYTEKQWGKKATELPAFIIKRIPINFSYDNRLFHDKYQGIPIGGYNKLIEGLLKGVEVRLNVNYLYEKAELDALAEKVVYTGPIDHYFNNQFGPLEYRSLRFEHEVLDQEDYQGRSSMNYTKADVPYTRIVEHKHFEFGTQKKTVITREYPAAWKPGMETYYPVNDEANNLKYAQYAELAKKEEKVIFGGRLAEYKYYNMDQIIASALTKVRAELEKIGLAHTLVQNVEA